MTEGKNRSVSWISWLLGASGLALAFTWGLAEGTLFFLVPDLVLTLTALFSFKIALRQTGAAVIGAMIAGALMFSWSSVDYAQSSDVVMSVPFVNESMTDTVRADLDADGALGLLKGPFSGIPYKVYAIEAPGRVGLLPFLIATIPARLERLFSGVLLFAAIGYWQRRRIQTKPHLALIGYGLYWSVLYTWYWTSI